MLFRGGMLALGRGAALLLTGACVPATHRVETATALSSADTFACVTRTANQLGYTVVSADRSLNLIRAERRDESRAVKLSGEVIYSELTISIFPATVAGQTTLRVTSGRSLQNQLGARVPLTGLRVDKDVGPADAAALAKSCGASP